MAKLRLPASKSGKILVLIGGILVLCICGFVGSAALVAITGGGKSAATTPAAEVAAVEEKGAPTTVANRAEMASATSAPQATSAPTKTLTPSATPPPTETQAPSATPAPTETQAPTTTPMPTSSPEPTATKAPTVTPEPTAAPRFSAEEIAYSTKVTQLMGTMSNAVQMIGEQSTAVAGDLTLLFDDDWKLKTVVALASLQVAAQDLRDIEAPVRFKDVQKELKDAAQHYINSTELYVDGVDQVSADKLTQASEEMNAGTEALQRAYAELKKIDPMFQ